VTRFVGPAGPLERLYASRIAGFAAVIIAVLGLVGWWAELPLLSSWGSGLAAMKPVTALCLAALGFALMFPRKDSRLAFAIGFTVIIVAALDLSQVLFNLELGIDRWLVPPDAVLEPWAGSFRVINGMPLALGLAGGSLALSRYERHHFAATTLAGLAGAMALFVVLTYPTGINTLYGSGSTSPPALPSAVGMLCIGTIVMEAMAERSVDGKVDLAYAPSGLIWRLTCPAANALEPGEREPSSRSMRKSN
jgi:hypothetical protein